MSFDWVKDLKAGDKVYIDKSRFGSTELELATVKKITPKGYVRTNDNSLFRNGIYRIDSWTSWSLIQWTQEIENKLYAEARFNYMCHTINAINLRDESVEKVQQIYDILTDGSRRASK